MELRDEVEAASQAIQSGQYEAAVVTLERLLDTGPNGLDGVAQVTRVPLLGMLAEARLQLGQADLAAPHLDEALKIADLRYDSESLVRLARVRHETARYLGDVVGAVKWADHAADLLDGLGLPEAARVYRRRVVNFPQGEPLLRVQVRVGERELEEEELRAVPESEERLQFVFARNRPTLRRSEQLTNEGDELAGNDDVEGALIKFAAAAEADPYNPHPRYMAGLGLLVSGRPEAARAAYLECNRLAPGWFQVRADLVLVDKVANGTLSPEVAGMLGVLEAGTLPPRDRRHFAEQLLGEVPTLAALHLARGRALLALGEPEQAAGAFSDGLAVTDDTDTRSRLLFEVGSLVLPSGDDSLARRAALEEAASIEGNLIAGAMARFLLRGDGALR